jgi:hypothetical protein
MLGSGNLFCCRRNSKMLLDVVGNPLSLAEAKFGLAAMTPSSYSPTASFLTHSNPLDLYINYKLDLFSLIFSTVIDFRWEKMKQDATGGWKGKKN